MGLTLEASPLRRGWPTAAGDTLVAVLVKLRPAGESPPLPLDLVFAIDAGAAMQGDRGLEPALAAARHAVGSVRASDRLGIVLFGDRGRMAVPLEPVGDGERARKAIADADRQTSAGRADLSAGIRAAAELLRPRRQPGRASRMVLVVGGPVTREVDAERDARVLAESGVGISAIGVGADWPAGLLTRLADAGRGELWHAPRPADLAAALHEEVAFDRALANGEALLHLQLAPGVRPRRVLRVFPGLAHWLPAQPEDELAIVRLGDVPGDRPTYVLVELVCGPQAAGPLKLATLSARWRPAGIAGRLATSDPLELVVGFGDAATAPHAETAYYVDRVQGYTLVEKALEAAAEGAAAKASQLLTNARRIADGRKSRIAEPLGAAITALEHEPGLDEAAAKALLVEARMPE